MPDTNEESNPKVILYILIFTFLFLWFFMTINYYNSLPKSVNIDKKINNGCPYYFKKVNTKLNDDGSIKSYICKNQYYLGKNIGDDFKQGKITLPVILAYLRSDPQEKKYWKRTIQNLDQQENDFEKALRIINKYNCIEDTVKRAQHFANIAKDSLGIFNHTKYKEILINLTDSSLTRFN